MAEFITGTEFVVRFNLIKASFSKVTNIGSRIEYDTLIEGGQNEHPMYFKKPKKKPDKVIFERGVCTSSIGNALQSLKAGTKVKNVMIFVKNNVDTERILYFNDGLILSKTYSSMDAMGKSVMIEKLEIIHSGLKEMQVLF